MQRNATSKLGLFLNPNTNGRRPQHILALNAPDYLLQCLLPVASLSVNLGGTVSEDDCLISVRVVPAGKEGNTVLGKTLVFGKANSGESISLKTGETLSSVKGTPSAASTGAGNKRGELPLAWPFSGTGNVISPRTSSLESAFAHVATCVLPGTSKKPKHSHTQCAMAVRLSRLRSLSTCPVHPGKKALSVYVRSSSAGMCCETTQQDFKC